MGDSGNSHWEAERVRRVYGEILVGEAEQQLNEKNFGGLFVDAEWTVANIRF